MRLFLCISCVLLLVSHVRVRANSKRPDSGLLIAEETEH